MSRDIVPFGLRLPPEMKMRIDDAARANLRSINSEIVVRLNASLDESDRPLQEYTDGDLIRELMSRYGRGDISIRIGKFDDPAKDEKSS